MREKDTRLLTIRASAQQRRQAWLGVCSRNGMRFIVGFLVVATVAVGYFKQTRHEEPAPPAKPPAQVATAQASPARPTSEHNWPKSSLDRVADVKRQVAQQRKEDGY